MKLVLLWCVIHSALAHRFLEWGRNRFGSIGDGNFSSINTPYLVDMDCYDLGMGTENAGCLNKTGYVYTWGRNLGPPNPKPRHDPYPAGLGPSMCVKLVEQAEHSACISSTGEVRLWAWNNVGQLGNGNTDDLDTIPAHQLHFNGKPAHCKEVSLGYYFSACIDFEGDLWMWGGVYGTSPVLIDQKPEHKCVKMPTQGAWCAGCLTKDDELIMWMQASNIGSYKTTVRSMNIKCSQFGFGYLSALCLTSENKLYLFQHNALQPVQQTWPWGGQASLPPYTIPTTPTLVTLPNMEVCSQISAGYQHYGCISTRGNLYMWGTNADGELGDGTFTQRPKPVLIPNSKCQYLILGAYRGACYID